jgi:hypothetical protein
MELNDFKAWDRDNPEGEAHGWIQWKGTNVCMDVHCKCGAHGHIDAEFAYFIKCAHCGRIYATGQNIKLIELTTPEQIAYGTEREPVESRDDDLTDDAMDPLPR